MLKYRGTYRVLYETDVRTGAACEFTFVPCRIAKGANICRHGEETLNAYIPSIKIIRRLLKEYPELFTKFQIGDKEGTILFKESDMGKVESLLKPRVLGKNVSPRPKKKRNLSEEQRQVLSDRMKSMNKLLELQRENEG